MANEGRRFTFVVEDTFQLLHDQGIVVVGFLHGEAKVGDAAYIMLSNNEIILTEIHGMEAGPNKIVQSAENQNLGLLFRDIKKKEDIPKLSVITSIRPQNTIDVNQSIENPQLLGLSFEYPSLNENSYYINLLIYVICHSNYLAAMYLDTQPQNNGDGTVTFTQNTTMGFPSLKDPEDETKSVIPVFTDWVALANWKNVFDETHPPKTLILRFPDAVSMCKDSFSGIVINPFGPVPIFLSKKMIEKITSMEGYQQEFVQNTTENTK